MRRHHPSLLRVRPVSVRSCSPSGFPLRPERQRDF